MTLMNRYDQIMAQITVTDEMRSRILSRVLDSDLEPAKPPRRPTLWRWAAAAACVAVIAMGGLLWQARPAQPPASSNVVLGPASHITQAASAQELAQLLGFPVEQPSDLPFQAEEYTYQAYFGEIAQITCTGSGQQAVLRKSTGTQDNSGDYSQYDHVTTFPVGQIEVELRENEGGPSLALWTDGRYAFSLSLSGTADREVWTAMVSGLTG